MNCSYLLDDQPCGADTAIAFMDFAVCEEHREVFAERLERNRRSIAVQAANHHPLEAFPGICYVVLLPDGTIKIGYSNTERLFTKRMTNLKCEQKAPIIVLAKLPGGFVTESVLHERFRESRLPGKGERFAYSPAIASFLEEQRLVRH